MPFHDLLLQIASYPDATPDAAIDGAIHIAESLGASITGLAVEVEIPIHSNTVADHLIGLSSLAKTAEAESRNACQRSLAQFTRIATSVGVYGDAISARANHYEVASVVARFARSRDLCILPIIHERDPQLEIAQTLIFQTGRPVLILRQGQAAALAPRPGVVAIAWDGSRGAARAVADAMPFLMMAEHVRVVTVLNEKPIALASPGSEMQRHLLTHGVSSTVDEIDSGGDRIGVALDRYIERQGVDLIVLGAYGHSRAQQFLLGGATQHVLSAPKCAALLSH